MARRGRPTIANKPTYVELGLRVTTADRKLIDEAVPLEAARLGVAASRNSFCLRAALVAARKELGMNDNAI